MLGKIFKENKLRIIFSYVVLVTENAVFALYPWMFGRAVDGLLSKDNSNFRLYMGLMTAGILIGSFRRVMDTRIFGRIWEKFSTGIISDLMKKKTDTNTTMVCAGLSPAYVDFLEWHMPHGVRSAINAGTALVMLYIAVPGPGVWMALVAIGVMISSDFVARKQAAWSARKIESMEQSTKAINESNETLMHESYAERIRCYIKGSDWEAAGWCVSDALSMVAEAMVVLALVSSNASMGVILSTTVYVGTLFGGMNGLAFFMARIRYLGVTGEKIAKALNKNPQTEESPMDNPILKEAAAYAANRGVDYDAFVDAFKRASKLRDEHAESEGVDPRIVPLNFIGRPKTDDHALNVVYAMVSERIREEAIEKALLEPQEV